MTSSRTERPTRNTPGEVRPLGAWGRLWQRLAPVRITAWVRAMALATVLANMTLILTGGAVRLTQSGLGCPTWPRCTDDSWSNVPEMGIHGYIEFGNRLLTFVLTVVAVLTWIAVTRLRARQRDLFVLATILALGIPVQAVVGGVSVHMELNPWVVGIHFILSGTMIALGGILYSRVRRYSLERVREAERLHDVDASDPLLRRLGIVALAVAAFAVYMGTLVTGTGPHSGDADSARHEFNAVLVTRMHSVPVWILLIVIVAILVLRARRAWAPGVARSAWLLVAVMVYQGAVGYVQYFNGLPGWLVELHLLGAALTIWAVAALFDRMTVLGTGALRERAVLRVDAPVDHRLAEAGRQAAERDAAGRETAERG
ncbi:COX15/CtaA family protein [Rothia sp. AR01]|uniref:COX15/CtaA family protein n=1 Tax=Rothia santali TaxID=2949643 RepID=A0A9X2KHA1_9MICC|nr:COX15/CtaA family protein [Rothia santali]MCP3424509.1 COX15/CtaA family protein [Rothia santali]